MADTSLAAMRLLEQYEERDSMPPTLKPAEQELVRQHLSNAGWGLVWGVRIESSLTIGGILSLDSQADVQLGRSGAIVGPYFLGEEYLPAGLGIYVPMSAAELDTLARDAD